MKHELAISILQKEIMKLFGEVVAEIWIRNHGDSKVKEMIETNDIILNLMSGKGFDSSWKVEEIEQYKKAQDLVNTLMVLKQLPTNEPPTAK